MTPASIDPRIGVAILGAIAAIAAATLAAVLIWAGVNSWLASDPNKPTPDEEAERDARWGLGLNEREQPTEDQAEQIRAFIAEEKARSKCQRR